MTATDAADILTGKTVAHLTTVASSLRYLLLPQLKAVVEAGGTAVGISAPGPEVAELERHGIRHVALEGSTRSARITADLRAAASLASVLRGLDVDILHTHNPKPGIYGRIVGRLGGVPIVVNTVHGLYATTDDPLAKRLVVYGLEAVAARFSHAELLQNPEDLETMRRLRAFPTGRARQLGNGVDLRRFGSERNTPAVRDAARAEIGASPSQVVVGTVGRLVAEKGYVELLEAAASLGDGYAFVVIGPSDPEKSDALAPELVEAASSRGVRFLGMRPDVELLYPGMDVFALPSHREGFPRAAMEASAMGLPVVATDIRGCRQVVEHAVTGFLVPPRDVSALTAAIEDLGSDPARRAAFGQAAASRARDLFDERDVVDIVMQTYRDLLAASTRERPTRRRRAGLTPGGDTVDQPRS